MYAVNIIIKGNSKDGVAVIQAEETGWHSSESEEGKKETNPGKQKGEECSVLSGISRRP